MSDQERFYYILNSILFEKKGNVKDFIRTIYRFLFNESEFMMYSFDMDGYETYQKSQSGEMERIALETLKECIEVNSALLKNKKVIVDQDLKNSLQQFLVAGAKEVGIDVKELDLSKDLKLQLERCLRNKAFSEDDVEKNQIFTIYVSNLPENTERGELKDMFEKYGKVKRCEIMQNFAFLHMAGEDEAKTAVQALNNTDLRGSKLSVLGYNFGFNTERENEDESMMDSTILTPVDIVSLKTMFDEYALYGKHIKDGLIDRSNISRWFRHSNLLRKKDAMFSQIELNRVYKELTGSDDAKISFEMFLQFLRVMENLKGLETHHLSRVLLTAGEAFDLYKNKVKAANGQKLAESDEESGEEEEEPEDKDVEK